jgi:hypothetical protein
MNLMTKDDFPVVQRKRCVCVRTEGSGDREEGEGDGNGGRVDAPTEREPSTAIFRFFKMSPVIGESSRGGEAGREEVGGGED